MSVRLHDVTHRLAARVQSRLTAGEEGDAGMVASEYVMGTAVAAGCVGVAYKIVTSPAFLDVVRHFILKRFDLFN
jgi:hypothetical protein